MAFRPGLHSLSDFKFEEYSNREITMFKRIISNENLFEEEKFRFQVYRFINAYKQSWSVCQDDSVFKHLSTLFSVSPSLLRCHYLKGEKETTILMEGKTMTRGRPTALSAEQEENLITHIITSSKAKNSLSHQEVNYHVRERYKIDVSNNFARDFVTRHNNRLKFVTATPMEEQRHELTRSSVDCYFGQLENLIKEIHPQFLYNMDESSVQSKPKQKKKNIIVDINDNSKKFFYSTPPVPSHITFVSGIWTDLTASRPMIIVTRKTVDTDLDYIGIPDSRIACLVHSDSGYIKGNLFIKFLQCCFLPDLDRKRSALGKPNAPCGIIMDNHSTHIQDDAMSLFKEHNVKPLFLPAHSSHLLQPLDRLTFSLWKAYLKRVSTSKALSDFSALIYRAITALQMATTPLHIQTAFERAGIVLTLAGDTVSITINKSRVLANAGTLIGEIDLSIESDEVSHDNEELSGTEAHNSISPHKKRKISEDYSRPLFPSFKN